MKSPGVGRQTDNELAGYANRHFDALVQEMLSRGLCLRFKAREAGMSPVIESGDTLLIENKNARELDSDDILFYRDLRGTYIVRRLVKKIDDSSLLLARGDNLPDTELVLDEQVVGRVIAAERDGHYVWLRNAANNAGRSVARLYSPAEQLLHRWRPLEAAMGTVQALSFYRRVARALRTGIKIREGSEAEAQMSLNPSEVKAEGLTVPGDIRATSFLAMTEKHTVGRVALLRRSHRYYPFDGYWLNGLMVNAASRGKGIGEELAAKVMNTSWKEGAKGLSLLVYEENHRAAALFRKLGFETVRNSALEKQLEDERRNFGRRQVHMFAQLN